MDKTPLISVVSPVYMAEKIIPSLISRIEVSLASVSSNFEIILVDDSSPDQSWEIIKKLAESRDYLKGIKLSRNFGQHYAITCGLDHAKGEWIVVMDCDLQDQPEEISHLYYKAIEGYDIVLARRTDRKDSFFKRGFSRLFYRSLSYLTGSKIDHSVANFGIYSKNVISAISQMRESIRYFPTMIQWVGFKQIAINVEHAPRSEGKTSYSFKKLLNLAIDIILAYSDKPIRLAIKSGFIVSIISLMVGLIYLWNYLLGEIVVPGYASLIISIWFLSGLIITILGIIGLYVGKTFEGIKHRPIYIIKETTK